MSDGYNVAFFLRKQAQQRPEQDAILFPAKGYSDANPQWERLTYKAFDELSDSFARGFQQQGIRPGDRVLMLMRPRLELWAVLFGLFKLGAVPVIMDPGMGRKRLLECIEQIGCRAVIAEWVVHLARSTVFRSAFKKAEVNISVGPKLFWANATLDDCKVAGGEPFPIASLDATDDAAIAFTSGSTGTPKGVGYHHGMWAAEVEAIAEMLDVQPGDASVQAFAAFAILDLCWGHTAVIPNINLSKPATASPQAIIDAITHNDAKMAFASPIVWTKLGRYAIERGVKLPTLTRAITTGAPTPIYIHELYKQILDPACEFHTPYGATEAIPVSHIASKEILDETAALTAKGHGTCVGHLAKGVEVQIIGITDAPIATWSDDLALPNGEIGEIAVRAPQVSRAYKERPKANEESKIAADEGFFHRMGDLGYLDEKGRLWFCGRKGHRIETADGMVPSVPAEGVFNEHPDVWRTALVGVGPRGREVPVLCVEMNPGKKWSTKVETDLEQLIAGTRWEGIVQRYLPHNDFPTDARHNSKIRRGDLKQWATQQCPDLAQGKEAA